MTDSDTQTLEGPPDWHRDAPVAEDDIPFDAGETSDQDNAEEGIRPAQARPILETPAMPGARWNEDPPLPPVNLEVEQGLLAAILSNANVIDRVGDVLLPEHFADEAHGRVFQACLDLAAEQKPVNAISLKRRFERDKGLAGVGGAQYLAELQANGALPSQAPHYARMIRQLYQCRMVMQGAAEAYHRLGASDEESVEDICTGLSGVIDAALGQDAQSEGLRPAGEGAVEWEAFLDRAKDDPGGLLGVSTGLTALDNKLRGLQNGKLYVIAGRPAMGKTSLALSIALHAARTGIPAAFFSLEMPAEELAGRAISMISGVPLDVQQDPRNMGREDWGRVLEASRALQKLPLQIDASPALTVPQIRARARRMKREAGLGPIVIDYLQLMTSGRDPRINLAEYIGQITTGLKQMAKALDVPILLLSQLNRAVEAREDKRPMLSDLRDSGSIEQDADVVIFPFRQHYYLKKSKPQRQDREEQEAFAKRMASWAERLDASEGRAEIILAKQRSGPEGSVQTAFKDNLTLFENLPEDTQERMDL